MHNVESPNASDSAIEQEIQARGLTAPRIMSADIDANIARVHYFTAAGALRCIAFCDGRTGDSAEPLPALELLTFCVLVLRNGFTVTGESACASPENFDAGIGRKIALDKARDKIWPLLGYALKEALYRADQHGGVEHV